MESSTAFLELLDEVVEDGELTYQEIYQLVKWINENKASRELWPIGEFIGLLKAVFADGKISQTEARAVGVLIQKVRRERALRNAIEVTPTIDSIVTGALANFSVDSARLPTIPLKIRINSQSDEGVEYIVDLSGPTCSCPDFNSVRRALPDAHLSRCCKHIFDAFAKVRPREGWPDWLDAFFELGMRPHPAQQWAVLKLGNERYLFSSAPKEWANVFVRVAGTNTRFGFSILEHRWAYGNEPVKADRIAAAVIELSDR